ncbi:MAG: PAS domain-containing protein, partial [Spirochaetales bacterium]|nr:PAS domain-containing protein [Spirochaetales bacterium]
MKEIEGIPGELANHLCEGIVFTNDLGQIVYTNQAFAEMLGRKPEELLELQPGQITSAESRKTLEQVLLLSENDKNYEYELEFLHRDGSKIAVIVQAFAHADRKHSGGSAVLVRNISHQKSKEHRLKSQKRELDSLIDHLHGFFYRCRYDAQWTMMFISRGCHEVTGYDPEEIIENSVISYEEIIDPLFRVKVRERWKAVIRSSAVYEDEYPITAKFGESKWVLERGWAVFDSSGDIEYLEGFIIDITEKKATELRLQASEQRYRMLFELLRDTAFLTDMSFTIFLANPQAAQEARCTYPEDLYGKNALSFLSHEHIGLVLNARDELIDTGQVRNIEVQINRLDGSVFPAEFSISLLTDIQGNPYGIMVVIRNV